ncbi:MAG: flagellar type III secretion system pore protein FliP [Elusimicrobiota bacterium]
MKINFEKLKTWFPVFTGMMVLFVANSVLAAGPSASPVMALPSWAEPKRLSVLLETLFVLTFVSFVPFLLLMTTCFLRIVIVLSFLRHALGTQQIPPTNILVGLGLVLTFFLMSPTIQKINENAFEPYNNKAISWNEALEKGSQPLRDFMLRQTRKKDLALSIKLGHIKKIENVKDLPFFVVMTAFVISELKTAFIIGFLIFIPFVVVDMVVATVLMSLGMMMVPPTTLSLPLKILLFVLMDGWNLLIQGLVESIR